MSNPGTAGNPCILLPPPRKRQLAPVVSAIGGPFPQEDDMTQAEEVRHLKAVEECHKWRAAQGNLNSMTYLALLTRIDALRKLEAGQS